MEFTKNHKQILPHREVLRNLNSGETNRLAQHIALRAPQNLLGLVF